MVSNRLHDNIYIYIYPFDQVITSSYNKVEGYTYLKVNGSKFIFLVLHAVDILLTCSDNGMLQDTREVLSKYFQMLDLCEATFVP